MNALTGIDFYPIVEPIIEVIDALLWPSIALLVSLGSLYCIYLGVKIAKADEQNSRLRAKKDLLGAIIGFILIFVLIVALKLSLPLLKSWVNANV